LRVKGRKRFREREAPRRSRSPGRLKDIEELLQLQQRDVGTFRKKTGEEEQKKRRGANIRFGDAIVAFCVRGAETVDDQEVGRCSSSSIVNHSSDFRSHL